MDRKSLINQLQLAYSPMCNYDFNILKHDPIIQELLRSSSLYVLAQRPELSFENIVPNEEEKHIDFEIHQKNNPQVLKCRLPFFQESIATDPEKEVLLYLGSNDPSHKFDILPITNVHGIKFYESSIDTENFLVWFSPEKFILNWLKGYFQADVEGDYRELLKYQVLYVGKATDQDIWERLTGHETLQEILSVEYPLVYGSLPTHEIALLLFEFHDNLSIRTFGDESSIDDMVDSLMGNDRPDQKTIFLDAEKALVKAMLPKHNKILFKGYPKSKDGLEKHNYDAFSYTFMDPITLIYDEGEIEGGLHYLGGDTIIVTDNKTMELLKHNKST